ncbi:hypothetical protein VAE151_500063 [Vibrio aestuarianus]|nr:hypothetical protein VAE032_220063 [Vibrio aestuarianus]CAH8182651.1 hypothetical protein VAE055_320063 [Vibrio aestuarianus]CAH8182733.1 hypothetical protein VAE128_420063 [Vibrio aestuarianus]CAH8182806.1 hypothetical protein VAE130_530063 [Vibrio aestuarianus]CAH8182903.1 hypothetical protein VAE115_270063 [Vibrio aestuarianus]
MDKYQSLVPVDSFRTYTAAQKIFSQSCSEKHKGRHDPPAF